MKDVLLKGDMENSEMNLYWDSWDRHHMRSGPSPRSLRPRDPRIFTPSEDSIPYNINNNFNNNNLNSDVLVQASSVNSLLSNASPPSTPPLVNQGQSEF